MFRKLSHMVNGLAAAVALTALTMSGPLMAETLSQPVSIPIDFVESIKESPDWLAAELNAKGLHSGWTIENAQLTTAELAVLQYVNRIRSFLKLDASIEQSYFILPLVDQNGARGACVTLYPRDILPKLGALDFRTEQYMVPDLGAEDVRKCMAKGASGQPFETMDRAAFRAEYFGESGNLDTDRFKGLVENPDFILKAFDLGFYPFRDSYSGNLHIS